MKHTRTIPFVFAATACVVATFVGPDSSSALSRAAATVCRPIIAAKWTEPTPPYKTGTKYDLSVHGNVTCRQAAGWVKTLVKRHVQNDKPFDGPRGWTCKAAASKTGQAYFGTCHPKREGGFLPRDYFDWTIG